MGSHWLLATNYPPVGGGVSRYYRDLVSTSSGRIRVAGVDGFEPPPPGNGIISRIRQAGWALKISKRILAPQKIMVGAPHLGLGAILAGKPFILFIHGGEWQKYPLGSLALSAVLRKADLIVVNSQATKDRWFAPQLFSKVVVIRPGVPDFVRTRELPSPKESASSGLRRPFRVLSVGRLSPRKGFETLVDSIKISQARGLDVELRIVGSGELEMSIRQRIDGSPSMSVETSKNDSELVEAYDWADLFALLPREIRGDEAWEGFGIVYLEAAARGLPIISTCSGGVMEAICPRGSRVLREDCVASEVAGAIIALAADHEKRRSMAEANLEWAASNIWSSRLSLIDSILQSERP